MRFMLTFTQLLKKLGLHSGSGFRYELTDELYSRVTTLAVKEGRSEQEIADALLDAGLTSYDTSANSWQRWQKLTPREQDVTAFVCMGYANKQIALRLGVSSETIKTHMHNVLDKFDVENRSELARLLRDWDFSAWEEQPPVHAKTAL